jgi:predicted enzyme related to lactoylglutathione lyase
VPDEARCLFDLAGLLRASARGDGLQEDERARRFWAGVLGVTLADRTSEQGQGWQTGDDRPALGLHARGTGPGDRVSLPYFAVDDMTAALERVRDLGGEVIHPGERWSVCRDSEGSPFGLTAGS